MRNCTFLTRTVKKSAKLKNDAHFAQWNNLGIQLADFLKGSVPSKKLSLAAKNHNSWDFMRSF